MRSSAHQALRELNRSTLSPSSWRHILPIERDSALASSEKEDWTREPVTRFVTFDRHWWKPAIFDPNLLAAARRGSSAR
jgi:hypothetical protein